MPITVQQLLLILPNAGKLSVTVFLPVFPCDELEPEVPDFSDIITQ